MKKIVLSFILFSLFLSSCSGRISLASPTLTSTYTVTPTITATATPTETPQPKEREEITLEDVKNVEFPLKIIADEDGNLTGLPEDVSPEIKAEVLGYYEAIQKKFVTSEVFYSRDPEGDNWFVYAILGGQLFYANNTDSGMNNYLDYPLIFTQKPDGTYELSGQYGLVNVTDALTVAWKNGFPQFLTEVYTAADGNTYARKYFDYQTAVKQDPWKKMSELFTMPKEAESTAPSELDLNPTYVETIDQKFMGVRINAELISSYEAALTEVYIPEDAYAEFIARTIFKVWWKKGDNPQNTIATETDFQNFMTLWAKAQETNNPEDWKKVEINEIWANDLKDGKGYVQKPYTIWPIFTGEAPEDVKGIEKISIAFVDTTKSKNISLATEITGSAYGFGFGTNIEGSALYILVGRNLLTRDYSDYQRYAGAVGLCDQTKNWLIGNKSGDLSDGILFSATDSDLFNFLYNNRLLTISFKY